MVKQAAAAMHLRSHMTLLEFGFVLVKGRGGKRKQEGREG